jgi:phosphoglycolate phosphatase
MSTKVVIFDWDGTLIDSVEHIAESLHAASQELGFPVLERTAYRNIIGLGMVEALKFLYPGINSQQMQDVREGYSRWFFSKPTTPQHVFKGMAEVLTDLGSAGLGRAVATGKSRRGLDAALVSSGLHAHFQITRCADETRSKPDPTMLEEIIRFYDIQPDEALMIGDTSYDLEMAQRIGMPAIGVQWGAHDELALKKYGPRSVVSSVTDLRAELGL